MSNRSWLGLLLTVGVAACAHVPSTPSVLEAELRDIRGAGPRLVVGKEALNQHQEAQHAFAEARREARRVRICAMDPVPAHLRWMCRDRKDATLDRIEVTGSRIKAVDLITNNQEAGIDEGDIVKKSGNFVIVLRQGILFSLDLASPDGQRLRVADRLAVAVDDSGRSVWYDEILALDGQLILLGYNYGQGYSELIGFRLDEIGRLHRDWHYFIRSDDYYSGDNYGVRLHGDALVLSLSTDLDHWPQWRRANDDDAGWQPLAEIDQVFIPGQVSSYPQIHLLLRCPLSALAAAKLDCRERAVVGDWQHVLYVAHEHAYLLLKDWDDALYLDAEFDSWRGHLRLDWSDLQSWRQTWVVKIPLEGDAPTQALRVRGWVEDQFANKVLDRDLHLLTRTSEDDDGARLFLHRLPPRAFERPGRGPYPPAHILEVPDRIGAQRLSDTTAWFATGNSDTENEGRSVARLVGVDLRTGARSEVRLDFLPDRLEPLAGYLVAIGSGDDHWRMMLTQDHSGARNLDSIKVHGHAPSDHRSHAFNFGHPAPGRLLFGIPAVPVSKDGKDHSEYPVSDLQFFEIENERLRTLATVDMQSAQSAPKDCQLSCYDWYGNARLFFVEERIFALSADQFVELELVGSRLIERARVRL